MARKRVYELARELKISSKEFIERAKALGYSGIQSHANTLEDDDARALKSQLSSGAGLPQPKKKTILKRRVQRGSGANGGYDLVTSRLSEKGEQVIERKQINVALVPPTIPSFTVSEPVSAPVKVSASPVAVAIQEPASTAPEVAETVTLANVSAATEALQQKSSPQSEPVVAAVESTPTTKATKTETASVAINEPAPKQVEAASVQVEAPEATPNETTPVQPKKAKTKKKKEPVAPPIRLGVNFREDDLIDRYKNVPEPPPVKVEEPAKEPQTAQVASSIQRHTAPRQVQPVMAEPVAIERNLRDRPSRRGVSENPNRKNDRTNSGGGGGNSGANDRGDRSKRQMVVPSRPTKTRGPKRDPKRQSKSQGPVTAPMSEKKRVVKVDEAITVGDLAHRMGVKASELIKKLLNRGSFATINQALSIGEATELAKEFNYEVQNVGFQEANVIPAEAAVAEAPELLEHRPPVVTVMGHVDHGKTSLLDAIRKTDVAASEAGGITQHIGASVVQIKKKGKLIFLDTPGHEAFTSMRSRGAQCTDIVILVVAADDGVMPQTIEAINHAKAAEVPIVVAVNKIDKPGADPNKARFALMQYDLVPEDLGGDVMMFNVSAHTREGLDELLEGVLLTAEVMELQANPNKPATGIVIESHMEKGRGPVATILVSEGTLNKGDTLVAGTEFGRIRAMYDDHNRPINSATPSIPVKVVGLSGTPEPGERFDIVADERAAKQIMEHRRLQKQKDVAAISGGLRPQIWGDSERKDLNIIIKADTQGTLEALRQSLLQLQHDEIELSIPHAAVGGITENDINLAATTNSLVFGFHVRADNKAQQAAEAAGVDIRIFRVIYELIDSVKAIMEKQLAPIFEEKPMGQAEIRKIYNIPKAGRVAGCYVTEGKITRGSLIRLFRDNIQIFEGKVATLRRFKDDVKEVATGFECGIQIEGYQDIRDSDMIEAYEIKEIAQKLEFNH